MPIKTIQRPDGGVDEIEYPENTPDEVVNAAVKVHLQSLRTAETERGVAENAARLRDVPPEFRGMSRAYEGMGAPTEQLMSPHVTSEGTKFALRTAPAIAAGVAATALTAPLSVPAQIGYGMLASGLASGAGETAAQSYEKSIGERAAFSPGQIAGATITGAAPAFKGAGTLGSGLLATAKTAGSQAAGGILGRAAEDVVEGRPVNELETVQAGAIPLAVSGGLGLLGNLAGAASRKVGSAAERVKPIEAIGLTPTTEQIFPSIAPSARRVVSEAGESAVVRKQYYNQSDDLRTAVINLIGGADPKSAKEIAANVMNALGEPGAEQFMINYSKLADVTDALDKVSDTATKARLETARQYIVNGLKDKIAKSLGLENVDAFEKVARGQAIASNVNDALKAYRATKKELYAPINYLENVPAFDINVPVGGGQSIADRARTLISKIPNISKLGDISELIEKLKPSAQAESGLVDLYGNTIASTVEQPPKLATWDELRGIAKKIEDYATDINSPFIGKEKSQLKEFAGSIRSAIEEQAPTAWGQDAADVLKKANRFVADFQDRFTDPGLKEIFKSGGDFAENSAQQIANDVLDKGVNTQKYQNIKTLFSELRKAGAENVPTDEAMKSSVRSAVVNSAITDNLNGTIDYNKLTETLSRMETASPGTMKELGFGSMEDLKKLANEMRGIPSAVSKENAADFIALIEKGNNAGTWIAADAVPRIKDTLTRDNLMSALQDASDKGNKSATDALRQIKTKYLDDLFDFASSELGLKKSVNAQGVLQSLDEKLASKEASSILGNETVKLLKEDIVPALKIMGEAQVEVGSVGAYPRGAQAQRLAETGGKVMQNASMGRFGKAFSAAFGRAFSEASYGLMSSAIVRGMGVSGLVKRQKFLEAIERIAALPSKTAQMQALYRYTAGEPEKK